MKGNGTVSAGDNNFGDPRCPPSLSVSGPQARVPEGTWSLQRPAGRSGVSNKRLYDSSVTACREANGFFIYAGSAFPAFLFCVLTVDRDKGTPSRNFHNTAVSLNAASRSCPGHPAARRRPSLVTSVVGAHGAQVGTRVVKTADPRGLHTPLLLAPQAVVRTRRTFLHALIIPWHGPTISLPRKERNCSKFQYTMGNNVVMKKIAYLSSCCFEN